MQNEKGQPAFEDIDGVLAEKIIDHTKTSADTSAQGKSNEVNEKSCSKRILSRLSKTAFLVFLSIFLAAFLLKKIRNNRR